MAGLKRRSQVGADTSQSGKVLEKTGSVDGKPLTTQQEMFAQLVASGRTQADACRVAYPKSQKWQKDNLYSHASHLAADPKVSARIRDLRAEIMLQMIEDAVVDKQFVLKRLKTVAERCLQTSPVVDRKGFPVVIETPDGNVAAAYTFEAAGANRALELLGKEVGMFVDRKEEGSPGDFEKNADKAVLRQSINVRNVRLGLAKVVPISKGKLKSA